MKMADGEIYIRYYQRRDRKVLRRIAYETSFLERADELFDEPELLADALTLYFTDIEPQSCFVAEKDGKVIGYLIGAKDETHMSRIAWLRIYPKLFWRALTSGLFLKQKTFRFLAGVIAGLVKGEFHSPDFAQEYPAIFHINVSRSARGHGVGKLLLTAYIDHLRKSGVSGVHLATMSDGARAFFERNGFKLLYTTSRSFLKYYFRKDIPYFILGKKLL